MFKNFLIIAVRNIKRHKGFSFINIFGLAIGITVCGLILFWVQDEISYDSYHKKLDNIYKVVLNVEGQWWDSSNWALSPILKQNYPEIKKASRYRAFPVLLTQGLNKFNETGAFVDEDFLEIFSYDFIGGNPETALSTVNSIILTRETAGKFFPSENPLGKVLTLNNRSEFTVTGIIENIPSNSTFQFDFLGSIQIFGEEKLNSWAVESFSYVLLQDDARVDELIEKISGIVMEYDKRTDQKVEVFLQPYKKLHLYSLSGGGPVLYVYLFSATAILILIIACINFINLTTARAKNRAREIGIRKVSGALKKNIILQFLCESVVLSFVALFFAIMLITLLLPAFNDLSGKQLALNLTGNFSNILFLIVITLVTGLLSGSYPAFVMSSFKPIQVLKASMIFGSGKSLFRKILVIGQLMATVVLIIGALIIYKQLNYINNKDLGFNRERIVVLSMNNALKQSYETFKNEIIEFPGVANVTCATNMPTNVGNINPVYWEGKTADDYTTINWVAIDYDYFDTFEMSLVEGRKFSRDLSTDIENYIVNEEAVKLMGFESAVGKMFSIWENEGKIIGVVKNFHSRSLHDGIVPVVFTIHPDWGWSLSRVFVKVKPGYISEALDNLKDAAAKYFPDYPFEYTFLDEHFENQYRGDRQIGTIFKYSGLIAIFISAMGLFGLAAFMVTQRTKEVGIRKVFGASRRNIMSLLMKEFLILNLVATIIALPIAYMVMKILLEDYAYRTDINIWIFISVAALTLFITLLSTGLQTLKASSTNPVETLKYE